MHIINKDTSLLELLQKVPRAKDVLERHGMACTGCMGSAVETIEEGAKMHGIDISSLLQELNELLACQE